MNFGELKAAVYDYLQAKPGNAVWKPSEVERYLNDGQMEFFRQIAKNYERFFSASATISEVANQQEYDLPTDLYQLLSVFEAPTGTDAAGQERRVPIRQINPSQENRWNDLWTADYRRSFFLRGQKKFVLNVPSSATATDSIEIDYIYRPANMVDDDDSPWQQAAGPTASGQDNLEEFHQMLWMHAAVFCLHKEGMPAEAAFLEAQLATRKQELLDHLDDIATAEPRYVNYDDQEVGETW